MAIFGKAIGRIPIKSVITGEVIMRDTIIREGNNWDIFLNYFFALLFMFCLLIGLALNPLIIIYHSKQKRSFANTLFLLISLIDQIKSLYFPIVFIPKLLSPQDDMDYYYIYEPSSINWTSYLNMVLISTTNVEILLLVILCAARYLTLKNPLSTAKMRAVVFTVTILTLFLFRLAYASLDYFGNPLGYSKVKDSVISMNISYIRSTIIPMSQVLLSSNCIFLLMGALFSGLTIVHLKNSDTAESESSIKNIRRGIITIVTMNVFNVFVILTAVGMSIVLHRMDGKWGDIEHSTINDFFMFANIYGVPLTQSAFNSLSFLIISSSFKAFLNNLASTRRINPWTQQRNQPTISVAKETAAH
jgi:hypothetical protein